MASRHPRNAKIGPATVPTGSLKPNPHNPRMLFDPLPMKVLEESIAKVGILVPITVFKAKGDEQFTILDGQRRWICAQRLKLPTVPINKIGEPSTTQNIVVMFQIHRLREDWELMPTALKLGVLMKELEERRDRHLAELTGLDVAVVVRCKKLLWYPKKFQDLMLFADPHQRIKADFFIELYAILTDRVVSKLPWFDRDELIERFLHKYQNKLSELKSVTDFRKIKQFITVARRAGQIKEFSKKFREFVYNDSLSIGFLEIGVAVIHREAEKFVKTIDRMHHDLQKIEPSNFLGETRLWDGLERLFELIRRKLAAADRRIR